MKRFALMVAGLLLLVITVRAGLGAQDGLDYFDDASSAVDALARGDWHGFAVNQPLMGSFSILLRAPFVAPVYHADLTTVFIAGSVPCVLAAVALGLVLTRLVADAGASPAVQGLVAGLAVINPLTFRALHWGHPEEILTAVLCVGAVLAAMRERQGLAGVLLGLALASKQWAVLAILPTLLAAPSRRLLLAAAACAVAAVLTVPLLLLAPGEAADVAVSAGGQGSSASASTTPWNVWWPLAGLTDLGEPFGERYLLPGALARVSHPLIVALAVPLTFLLWRRPGRRPDDALLLLALLFLLRCVLDNWNNEYYHLPFVLALLTWEVHRTRSVPALTIAVMLAIGLTFYPEMERLYRESAPHARLWNAVYLGWALPLLAGLGLALYRPRFATRLAERQRARGGQAAMPAP